MKNKNKQTKFPVVSMHFLESPFPDLFGAGPRFLALGVAQSHSTSLLGLSYGVLDYLDYGNAHIILLIHTPRLG